MRPNTESRNASAKHPFAPDGNRISLKISGVTDELCASTIVYGKAKNNFQYSVFCIIIHFLNDYMSKYSKAQIKCQHFFAKKSKTYVWKGVIS